MLLSIVIMVFGTALMAILPTYCTIGIPAPISVLISRLLQGFAVAGEFGSATAFLVEHSRERKGFFATFQWFGQGLAAVLASLFGVILSARSRRTSSTAGAGACPFSSAC